MMNMEFNEVDYARSVFDAEIEELQRVRDHLNGSIKDVANLILKSKGKVVVTGIGKSGLIGKKIAATLASTGTHAIFMNSAEGLHGDLGMICSEDVVLAISNSGNSDEIVSLLPSIEKIGASVVAMTGNRNSKLGKAADYILDIGVTKEGCPINLAPMSSTTSTLVMGDALAAILIKRRDFKPENFAVYHPGGSLGKRLLMKVKDIMKKGDEIPLCDKESSINDVIMTMTEKSLGAVCVMNSDLMVGIITEGDIRRALSRKEEFFNLKAKDIMTRNYTKTDENSMAIDALALMENRDSQISILPVMNGLKLVGMVRVHDLLNVVGR
ncbi:MULTISPECIES: KpsF/GutQ family sugar-phosphate isomerase [Fusobacterium]|uniref:KpsF/GutQ family sugar-phosphate isomerase n=2 Tax=Fusobacteriaceae TaxID=203492 RepID=A0A7G9GWK0_9FUSO|nr:MULTISPECIES: KpsF/GutQ family sugar-phosphate isomerase [Fusobacterium]QNM15182.1 KpsF/GutQ family sugar-phosphate isomerase [Fusobacterium hominis]